MRLPVALLTCVLSLPMVVPSAALAQFARRDDRRRGDWVCVYQDHNFNGWEQCFSVGDQIPDLYGSRNHISSIRLAGNVRVVLYEDRNFQGASLVIDSDAYDLARVAAGRWDSTWNDRVESLRVVSGRGPRFPTFDRRDYSQEPQSGICVYEDSGYRGDFACWNAGDAIRDVGRELNDRISSIRVFGREQIVLYRDIDFFGQGIVIEGDVYDLTQLPLRGASSWNDQISSLEVHGPGGRGGRSRGRR